MFHIESCGGLLFASILHFGSNINIYSTRVYVTPQHDKSIYQRLKCASQVTVACVSPWFGIENTKQVTCMPQKSGSTQQHKP